MSSFFDPAMADLWAEIQRYKADVAAPSQSQGSFPQDLTMFDFKLPLGRKAMAQALGQDMARAWLRKHDMPPTPEALRQEMLAENPAWAQRMVVAYRCRRALEAMPDTDFFWRELRGACRPKPGQFVLYFFDAVGSHAGYFAPEGHTQIFCGLFGGFLGGEEVSLWMPMPGLEEEIPFEVEGAEEGGA